MICNKCNIDKPINEFYTNKWNGISYIRKQCIACTNSHQIEYRRNSGNDKIKQYRRKFENISRENLTDRVIKKQLKRDGIPVTKEFIEIKRAQIILKRNICRLSLT